jgi:hypothetical protein
MHAEAVRNDAIPSTQGLLRDESHPVKCSECNVAYLLHHDDEAEAALTFCGILAEEIVTARHPDHARNVVLDLIALAQAQQGKTQVWSTRSSLSSLLKKKTGHRQERCPTAAAERARGARVHLHLALS